MSKKKNPEDKKEQRKNDPAKITKGRAKGLEEQSEPAVPSSDAHKPSADDENIGDTDKRTVVNTDEQKHATNRDAIRSDSIANSDE